ncbi:hypothetical protein T02_10161 [Trichinella nativa]|uniref:Uncharacterized protein n=1 Tax=Trichinella nativa TaxID=6335 RepID=A0A0V1KWD2_9BILA|nr:hypothetical protein T02_10161 [Trichinella nativa]
MEHKYFFTTNTLLTYCIELFDFTYLKTSLIKYCKAHTFCRRDNDIVKQTTTSMHGEKNPNQTEFGQFKEIQDIKKTRKFHISPSPHQALSLCFNKELHEKENFQTHWPKALLVNF